MKDFCLATLNRVITAYLAGMFVCALCLIGCSEPAGSGSNASLSPGESEIDFETQANRPPTTKTLYSMAVVLAAQGRDTDCEYVLRRIIQQEPRFLPAYNSLAELQMRQRHIDDAIKTISGGLQLRPQDPVLLNNLGMCWMVRRDYEKALDMFTKAAGVMPANTRYRANMATVLGLMGRDEESLSIFRQILSESQAAHNLNAIREARNKVNPAFEPEFTK